MKTEISRIKIKQILKSYIKENKTSNIILEQNQDVALRTKLQGMLSCFNPEINAKVIEMSNDGNPSHKFSIQTSGKTYGIRYWYIDGMVAVTDATYKNISFVKTKTGEYQKWKVELCSQGTQTSGYTSNQISFIKDFKLKNVGAKEENELEGLDTKKYKRKLVSPKTDRIFPEDFYMFIPPANLNTLTSSTITDEFKTKVKALTPDNNKDCKKLVKTFYDAYTNRLPPPDNIEILKSNVKACRTRFYQKWGFLQGGNNLDIMLDVVSQVKYDNPWFVPGGLDD